ncbi:MAG: Uma2 family endonuclease [Pyrinomonadaceae bacterium]
MSAVLKQNYTLEEYFELDRNSDANYEYFDGEIFEMSGVSPNHARIEHRLNRIFGARADEKGCEVFPANLRIKVPDLPPYRYPDLSVVCGAAKFETIGGLECLTNPKMLVEVLSNSTASFDKGDKFKFYKSIESFNEYLLISQFEKLVTQYIRHNERFWLRGDYETGETIKITTLDFDLNVEEIYQGVVFESAANSKVNE